jgi:hypothetical protein
MMCRMDTSYYAEIAIREWGEPERYQTIGPFVADPDDSDPEGTLEDNLRRQGDDVIRVWTERDPWANDPDRTTRQFVASVPPGGQR